ncbi:C45 family autoproteolytic acyltransferase/hydrolase [Psychroflexus sp. CAK57W]|uniref:C45 family autoproteolytic acyltransferase/hydolase n=1 Tax=Psychroflexus curvus TaxID=2873595 RepID=UPI001CCDF560|nr:C45 family peptidase [Psychroflexus curvus]MBZ9626502.1 C45 family autoproteolytic acyltransferase/hydrolase [Psychroflexus curvus]MBZ9786268.1 C45 family autoproteolytic acyltransferase/hydrolase [Psychroflexus curvus]
MQINFKTISEPGLPGSKWQNMFFTHWEAYKKWLIENEKEVPTADLETSQLALKTYMPELWPTYERLCYLVNADELGAKFLTGYQPPFYVSGCSNAILEGDDFQLVRNYDHHPDLFEGIQILTKWNQKKVIATSDCLIGILDGINEDGLVVSLTFGGRKITGEGFGIPFILRYVLEFCSNVDEAVDALIRIPSHMAYNVSVADKSGSYKTIRVAPDEKAVITNSAYTTNHQKKVDWPENARFNKTVERSLFLSHLLEEKDLSSEDLVSAFLRKPLYNDLFKEGFGTLFTAAYSPKSGRVGLHWPGKKISQGFDDFEEREESIHLHQRRKKRSKNNQFAMPYKGYAAKTITYSNPLLNKATSEKSKEITKEFLKEVWSSTKS